MRNIILSLILANLLLIGWRAWIAPGDAQDPLAVAHAGLQSGAQLVLYEPAVRPAQTTGRDPGAGGAAAPAGWAGGDDSAAAMEPAVAVMHCERIGPFSSAEPAASIASQLGRRGMRASLARETGDIWVGHWVQVMDLGSPASAQQAVDKLVRAGLNDAYIVRTRPTIDISLGVFRGQPGADRVIAVARRIGLEPEQTERYRAGTQHWVNVELNGAQSLELTDLQLASTQILRTEAVACRPRADTLAGAGSADPDTLAASPEGD